MSSRLILVFAVATMFTVTACGGAADAPGGGSTAQPSTGELIGTEWVVDGFEIGGRPFELVAGASPTVVFVADRPQIAGTTGCNSYFADVEYGAAGELVVGGVGQTEMACAPERVMVQESEFTAALSAVRFYELDGDRLTLASGEGSVVITAVLEDAAGLPLELEDAVWIADTRIEGEAASTLVAGTVVSLRFDRAAGTVAGTSGCNDFGASYVTDDDRIRVSGLEATEQGCEPAVMEQERFIYDVLLGAESFTIDDDRLTIVSGDGRGLSLRPAEG